MVREMKNSGVKWIGEIPNHWTCCKQKYLITLLNGRAYKDSEFEEDGKYKILRVGNLFTNPIWYTSSLELDPNKYCQDGDLLYSWSMSYAPVIWHGEKVIYHYHIWKTILSEKISKIFAYYYFISLTNALRAEIHETTMGFITMGVMNNANIAFPPLSEQQVIANFLDVKCAEIDGLLADLDAEVKTLTEYKKSIIAETVTQGLNPNVPMKQSGIPWADYIPVHWRIQKGKYTFRLLQRPVKEDDGVITCFRDGEVTLRSNRREEGFTMSTKEYGYQGIEPGDLVVHGMDGFAGSIGISDSRGKGTPVLNVLDSDHNKWYLMYYLRNMAYGDVFLALSTGIRVRSCDLSWKKLGEIRIVLPPIEEQNAIATYLDEKCAAIDQAITDKQTQIETLKSYKASLIYEYVTGKKQVI